MRHFPAMHSSALRSTIVQWSAYSNDGLGDTHPLHPRCRLRPSRWPGSTSDVFAANASSWR
jgi:hypothetical protein